jgi:hypothetical protein
VHEVTTMNLRRIAALVATIALAALVLKQATSAAQPAKENAAAKGAPAAGEDFATRYARAQLRLAELTLQKAQDMNRRVPQTLAKGVVEQFADDVQFAKAQVEAAARGQTDPFNLWLRRAEIDLREREDRLKIVSEANRRVKGAYTALDLERLRAGIELARLRVDHGRSLADASPEAKLQWQLEMISESLNRVDEMVTLSIQNRLAEFF